VYPLPRLLREDFGEAAADPVVLELEELKVYPLFDQENETS